MAKYTPPQRRRKRKRKEKRPDSDYLESARNLSIVVPKLKKYKKRKTLKPSEKSAIRRRERQLQNIPYLVPLTKKQARTVGRKKLFLPGVQAIQLRNVPDTAEIKFQRGGLEVKENGRRWVYWSLDRDVVRSRRSMRAAGQAAFEKKFPIEIVADLTERAFKQYQVKQVHLWAHAGIVGDAFDDLGAFIEWVNEKWQNGRYMGGHRRGPAERYSNPSDPGEWVNGIAILLEEQ